MWVVLVSSVTAFYTFFHPEEYLFSERYVGFLGIYLQLPVVVLIACIWNDDVFVIFRSLTIFVIQNGLESI